MKTSGFVLHRQLINPGRHGITFVLDDHHQLRHASHLISATYTAGDGRLFSVYPLPILPCQLRRCVNYFSNQLAAAIDESNRGQ